MHHLVFAANPPTRKGPRRTGKMPPALAKYWKKKNAMSKKTRRKSRKIHRRKARRVVRRSHRRRHVRRVRRHVRMHRRVRRSHRRRTHRRKARYRTVTRHVVRHVTRRVRVNPTGGKMLPLIGGAVAGVYGLSLLNSMFASSLPQVGSGSFTLANALPAGEGYLAYRLLRRKAPNFAKGLLYGGIASSLLLMFAPSVLASLPGMSSMALNPTGAAGTGATGGYGGTATGAYLGGGRRRRRMGAYLGGPNSSYRRMRSAMGMKAYLSPGKPIQSLIGPVSPARKTFGQAGNLSGIYTSGAFSKNAWSR